MSIAINSTDISIKSVLVGYLGLCSKCCADEKEEEELKRKYKKLNLLMRFSFVPRNRSKPTFLVGMSSLCVRHLLRQSTRILC